jgi:hypothetical protein
MTNHPDPKFTGHYTDRDATLDSVVQLDVINGRDAVYMTTRTELFGGMVKTEASVTLEPAAAVKLRDQLTTMAVFNEWERPATLPPGIRASLSILVNQAHQGLDSGRNEQDVLADVLASINTLLGAS